MKIKNIFIGSLAFVTLAFTSCQNFDELAVNPNAPTIAPASLVFNGVCNDINNIYSSTPWNDASKYAQYWCVNYNYYGNQDYGWTNSPLTFGTLYNVQKMEQEAIRNGAKDVNPFAAIGKFMKSYFYTQMSLRVGDVPLTDALKSAENVFKPKYDSQKAVFQQSLKWLDEANDNLIALIGAADVSLSGDIYLGNDLRKWQKVVNTYRLRLLIHLSKKEADTDLNIKKQYSDILSNSSKYPVLTGMGDNLQYNYNSSANKYPTNPDNFGNDATRNNMAKTYVDILKDLKDPRLFVTCEPTDTALKLGKARTDFDAYEGASSGEGLDVMSTKALKGQYSFINRKRYYANYTSEPNILVGYVELCFNNAEAVNRGWATGNADDWYTKGITASMKFYGADDATIATYLAQAKVKYKGNTADGLTQILNQKYLGFFQNSGWESFYNQRRTGIPTFLVGPANANAQRIPKRWQYPLSERTTNADNWTAALKTQFDGGNTDDVNGALWIIK
jgi:Starch-binding associating with outer membrane